MKFAEVQRLTRHVCDVVLCRKGMNGHRSWSAESPHEPVVKELRFDDMLECYEELPIGEFVEIMTVVNFEPVNASLFTKQSLRMCLVRNPPLEF